MVRELSMMGLELSHDELKFMKTKNLSSFCFLNFTYYYFHSAIYHHWFDLQGGAIDKLISLFNGVYLIPTELSRSQGFWLNIANFRL